MAKRIGWPFAVFVIVGTLSGFLGLLFLGYQELFAVYETSVQTEGGVPEELELGEGIVVTFSVPVQQASVISALHPNIESTISWDHEVVEGYATILTVTPTESVRAGESVVLSLNGIRSLFGTTLPERLYAFRTRPIPSVAQIQCGDGVTSCLATDTLTVRWDGSFDYAAATYALESETLLSASQQGNVVELTPTRNAEDFPDQDTLIIRLFEGKDGGTLIGRTPLWEEQFPLSFARIDNNEEKKNSPE